ncbi:MAG: Gfo/Idh/MocA family protein, partial [Planctomycetota bacterium]
WEITHNFVDAILDGVPLIAPAPEGINAVELANTMVYSSLLKKPVNLPMKASAYEKELKKLIKNSRFVKKVSKDVKVDMNASFK